MAEGAVSEVARPTFPRLIEAVPSTHLGGGQAATSRCPPTRPPPGRGECIGRGDQGVEHRPVAGLRLAEFRDPPTRPGTARRARGDYRGASRRPGRRTWRRGGRGPPSDCLEDRTQRSQGRGRSSSGQAGNAPRTARARGEADADVAVADGLIHLVEPGALVDQRLGDPSIAAPRDGPARSPAGRGRGNGSRDRSRGIRTDFDPRSGGGVGPGGSGGRGVEPGEPGVVELQDRERDAGHLQGREERPGEGPLDDDPLARQRRQRPRATMASSIAVVPPRPLTSKATRSGVHRIHAGSSRAGGGRGRRRARRGSNDARLAVDPQAELDLAGPG